MFEALYNFISFVTTWFLIRKMERVGGEVRLSSQQMLATVEAMREAMLQGDEIMDAVLAEQARRHTEEWSAASRELDRIHTEIHARRSRAITVASAICKGGILAKYWVTRMFWWPLDVLRR